MDICFKPSDATLDSINICLEKPFITESQLMNKQQSLCISGVKRKVMICEWGRHTHTHTHTISFLDFKMMHEIHTMGSPTPHTSHTHTPSAKGWYPTLSEILNFSEKFTETDSHTHTHTHTFPLTHAVWTSFLSLSIQVPATAACCLARAAAERERKMQRWAFGLECPSFKTIDKINKVKYVSLALLALFPLPERSLK